MDTDKARAWASKRWPYAEHIESWLEPPMPYGDSVRVRGGATMEVWPLRGDLLEKVKEIAKEWAPGFRLILGEPVTEDSTTPNARGVMYFEGDVPAWFEIDDVDEALEIIDKRTDVPLPLMIDPVRYADDGRYRRAVDTYHEYYVTYFWSGRPKSARDDEADE